MDTPTIWVVTRGNDQPYAYVTADTWVNALKAADSHPKVSKQRRIDGRYAIRRLWPDEIQRLTPDQLAEAEGNTA